MKHAFAERPDKALVQPTLENWAHWADGAEEELQQRKQQLKKDYDLSKSDKEKIAILAEIGAIEKILGENPQ